MEHVSILSDMAGTPAVGHRRVQGTSDRTQHRETENVTLLSRQWPLCTRRDSHTGRCTVSPSIPTFPALKMRVVLTLWLAWQRSQDWEHSLCKGNRPRQSCRHHHQQHALLSFSCQDACCRFDLLVGADFGMSRRVIGASGHGDTVLYAPP